MATLEDLVHHAVEYYLVIKGNPFIPSDAYLEQHITREHNNLFLQILVPCIFVGNIYESHAKIQNIANFSITSLKYCCMLQHGEP